MRRVTLKGRMRDGVGTRAVWKLRKEGWIPANLYGHGESNVHFQLPEAEVMRVIHQGHHMVTLDLGGMQNHGLLKEIQYDHLGDRIVHLDFARISLDEVIETSVPLHVRGTPKGVSTGGILDIIHHEIPLRGKVLELPEYIELEVGDLLINQGIRARQLVLPPGVTVALEPDEPVLMVHPPKGIEEAKPAAEAAATVETAAEPKESEE